MFHSRMVRALTAAMLLAIAAGAQARELASAPEISIIGFSRDGRLFAYEQFQDGDVSETAIAAIDVIARDGTRTVQGFPFGFLGLSKNGEFPLRVGGHKIKLGDDEDSAKKLAALRSAIGRQTAARIKTLGIGPPGRRLAGRSTTDRTQSPATVDFVLGATLPGPVPDLQPLYRASAKFSPDDQKRCVKDMKTVDHKITLQIDALDPGDKAVRGTNKTELSWPAGDKECASTLRITDVIAPPGPAGDGPQFVVVVVVLATSWGGHAESARYFAAFIRLP
jgi:hypothetical protein